MTQEKIDRPEFLTNSVTVSDAAHYLRCNMAGIDKLIRCGLLDVMRNPTNHSAERHVSTETLAEVMTWLTPEIADREQRIISVQKPFRN